MQKIRKGVAALCAAVAITMFLGQPAAQAATATDTLRYQVVNAHNDERAPYCNNTPLSLHTQLKYAAQSHANDMADRNYFSHSTMYPYPYPYGGSDWWRRPAYWGVTSQYLGENIAANYSTVAGVMGGWMASSTHRANILECHFRYMGVGWNSDGNYWVVDFGGYQDL